MMKQTKKRIVTDLVLMIIMTLIAFTSLLNLNKNGVSIAGVSTIIGAALFFIMIRRNKRLGYGIGLSGKTFIQDIKNNWLFIIMPSLINVICIAVSKIILPDYVEHVIGRTDSVISFHEILLMTIQFIVFAFVEEIAWRGFLQKTMKLYTNSIISIIITSAVFAIGHAAQGDIAIVTYDVFFVFCNSIFYGLVFDKSKNAYASAVSHFLANLSGALILLYMI